MDKRHPARSAKQQRAATQGRYIKAARVLRNMGRAELGALMEADGLGRQDPKRLEDGSLQLQRVHADSLSRHLRMPLVWFLEPDAALRDPVETERELESMWRDFALEESEAAQEGGELDQAGT